MDFSLSPELLALREEALEVGGVLLLIFALLERRERL